jgi:hypothetical protein
VLPTKINRFLQFAAQNMESVLREVYRAVIVVGQKHCLWIDVKKYAISGCYFQAFRFPWALYVRLSMILIKCYRHV